MVSTGVGEKIKNPNQSIILSNKDEKERVKSKSGNQRRLPMRY